MQLHSVFKLTVTFSFLRVPRTGLFDGTTGGLCGVSLHIEIGIFFFCLVMRVLKRENRRRTVRVRRTANTNGNGVTFQTGGRTPSRDPFCRHEIRYDIRFLFINSKSFLMYPSHLVVGSSDAVKGGKKTKKKIEMKKKKKRNRTQRFGQPFGNFLEISTYRERWNGNPGITFERRHEYTGRFILNAAAVLDTDNPLISRHHSNNVCT